MKLFFLCAAAVLPVITSLAADRDTPSTNLVVVRAGHWLDVTNGKTLERQVILVEGDTINWSSFNPECIVISETLH